MLWNAPTSTCSPVVPRPQTVASELVEVGGGATTMMRSPLSKGSSEMMFKLQG